MKLIGVALSVGLMFSATGCPNQSLNNSRTAQKAGTTALGQKQYESAISEFEKATLAYPDNHEAWYYMGGAYLESGKPDKAVDSLEKAVQMVPDNAMYQMWYGIALYDKAYNEARDEQAHKQGKPVNEVTPDLTGVSFEKAQQSLAEAVKLAPDLWRAHQYLGRIYRATDKSKEAADEFSKALTANPREPSLYVALGELYRKWDYTDEAIKVASQGTTNVPGANEVSDIWFDLGMGYDDKRMDDKAIEAFTKAIESSKNDHKAQFQRGQTYFRKGDYTDAKRDLEEFNKTGGASLAFEKQMATKMLMDISAKTAPPVDKTATEKPSPADLVKNKALPPPHPRH